jgi:hypothetical protein
MSTWNHRVVRATNSFGDVWFAIHEAHYRSSDTVPDMVSSDPLPVVGETIDDLRWTLERMLAALDLPVIEFVPNPADPSIGTWQERTDGQ